jgi:hypothetical protein
MSLGWCKLEISKRKVIQMGMDVYGKNPSSEVGEYFRSNVWYWHPLWEYCEVNFPELAGKVKHGHTNDGDGLNGRDSLKLAMAIRGTIANGVATQYASERNATLAELERPACKHCEGTGIRSDAIGVEHGMPTKELSPEIASITGRTHGWCNGCSGEGKVDAWETNYTFDLEVLAEFADFLENCGGFEIC